MHKFVWPRRAPKVNRLPPRKELKSLLFLESPNPQPTLPGMTSFASKVPFPIWEFYFDICEWRILPARAWTPALMLHLTNPCAKQKVLSLTKQKCKIYKTKSLGIYITSFSKTDSDLNIYHFVVWSNFSLFLNTQLITFSSSQAKFFLHLLCSFFHSFIMWLNLSSLWSHNLHLLFRCVLSIFSLI